MSHVFEDDISASERVVRFDCSLFYSVALHHMSAFMTQSLEMDPTFSLCYLFFYCHSVGIV